MASGDRPRPDWLAETLRAWTPSSLVPPSVGDAMRPVAELFGFAPAALLRGLVDTATTDLVGKRLAADVGGTEVSGVLRGVRPERAPLGLAVGQLGTASIDVDDLDSGDLRVAHLRLDLRNLHVQPGIGTSTVVAAPISWRATLDQRQVRAVLAGRSPQLEVELGPSGLVRVWLRGRRDWGHVDARPHLHGRAVRFEPTAATLGRWDVTALGRRIPRPRVDLPAMPPWAHLASVEVADGQLIVEGTVEEWRFDVGPGEIEALHRRALAHRRGPFRL